MAKKKIKAEMITYTGDGAEKFARVRVTKTLADELGLVAKENWLYMSLDWMGVLSAQAMIEEVLDEEGYKVYANPDVMDTAHFTDGVTPLVWKVTEWE